MRIAYRQIDIHMVLQLQESQGTTSSVAHTQFYMHSMFINNRTELVSLSEVCLPSKLSLLSITFCKKKKLMLRKECGLHELECLSWLEIEE